MRRPLAASSVLLLAAAWLAGSAGAALAAPYSVEIRRPASEDGLAAVRGRVAIEAEAMGLGRPSEAAYVVTAPDGGWDAAAAAALSPAGSGVWTGTLDTRGLPNGRHRLIVRAWGGSAGSYDPDDESTYAAANVILEVSNAPPTPTGVHVEGAPGAVTATWEDIDTASRSDFAGYEISLAEANGSCPGFGDAYEPRATTFATAHTVGGLEPGRVCAVVRALRTSPGTGTVASRPSPPVAVAVTRGAASSSPGDEAYSPDLPYSPVTEITPIAEGPEALEAGHDEGRDRWAWMAGGLAVAVLGLLFARYVRTAPRA